MVRLFEKSWAKLLIVDGRTKAVPDLFDHCVCQPNFAAKVN